MKLLVPTLAITAATLGAAGSAAIPQSPDVLCGIERPSDTSVQGPRFPGQVLHATWPPIGCNE